LKSVKFLILFCLINNFLLAQGISNNWLLGYLTAPLVTGTSAKGKVDFYTGAASVSSIITKLTFHHTQGNISDVNGNLIMSSNGIFIANALGDTMLNGGVLNPDPNVVANFSQTGLKISNGNIFLPYPGDSGKFILFHQSIVDTPLCCTSILYYSIIDISLDGGLGAVVQKNNLLPLPQLSGGIAATKHANGRDWWLLVAQDTSNVMWKILLTPQGITSINSQAFSTNLTFFGSESQACFSPDGTKYGFITLRGINFPKWTNIIRYFNFDRCSGNLSELSSIPIPDTTICRGLTFSPNSKFLYACSHKVIYQLNTDSVNVPSSIDTVAVYDGFTTPPGNFSNEFELLYRATDDKIYASTYSSTLSLHKINYPDSAGVACDVQQHVLSIPCYNHSTTPNHPNYFLGSEVGSPCDTLLGLKQKISKEVHDFTIAPNPAKDEVVLYLENSINDESNLEILSTKGVLIERIVLPENKSTYYINTSNYANGVYYVKIASSSSQSRILKLVILK
jgi:hypothetical protein